MLRGGGVVDAEGYLPWHVQTKTLKMISSNYNIITQYMFGETMSTTTKLRRRKMMYKTISIYTDITYNDKHT